MSIAANPNFSSSGYKKSSSRAKKSKSPIPDINSLERRSWEAWGQREESIFFDSLVRNSRNWGAIAADIGTKRSEQVRTYYYRVLRKISRLLQAVHFSFDNRDRINTLIALLAYWEAKVDTQLEETTIEFADAIKERIVRQRKELDAARSKRHPTPDKLTLQLIPSTEADAGTLIAANYNPKLQLTLKSKKSLSSIVEHLTAKWVTPDGEPLYPTPLRLYIPEKLDHPGYGIDCIDVSILSVFHSMGSPAVCKLEYTWDPDYRNRQPHILPGHELSEIHSTSDEGSDDLSDHNGCISPRSNGSNTNNHNNPMMITNNNLQAGTNAFMPATTGSINLSGVISGGINEDTHNNAQIISPSAVNSNLHNFVSGGHNPQHCPNRLAVPETMTDVNDSALDDDALRHGQRVRLAAKLSSGTVLPGNVSLSPSEAPISSKSQNHQSSQQRGSHNSAPIPRDSLTSSSTPSNPTGRYGTRSASRKLQQQATNVETKQSKVTSSNNMLNNPPNSDSLPDLPMAPSSPFAASNIDGYNNQSGANSAGGLGDSSSLLRNSQNASTYPGFATYSTPNIYQQQQQQRSSNANSGIGQSNSMLQQQQQFGGSNSSLSGLAAGVGVGDDSAMNLDQNSVDFGMSFQSSVVDDGDGTTVDFPAYQDNSTYYDSRTDDDSIYVSSTSAANFGMGSKQSSRNGSSSSNSYIQSSNQYAVTPQFANSNAAGATIINQHNHYYQMTPQSNWMDTTYYTNPSSNPHNGNQQYADYSYASASSYHQQQQQQYGQTGGTDYNSFSPQHPYGSSQAYNKFK